MQWTKTIQFFHDRGSNINAMVKFSDKAKQQVKSGNAQSQYQLPPNNSIVHVTIYKCARLPTCKKEGRGTKITEAESTPSYLVSAKDRSISA